MKYYLLKYNQNFADEINVPALACFNENDYNKWLELPVCKTNPDYDKEVEIYNNYRKAEKELIDRLNSTLGSNFRSVSFDKWPKDLYNEYEELPKKFGYKYNKYSRHYISHPKKIQSSYIRAYLGNWGDGFDKYFYQYSTMKDMVDDKTVKVSEVSEEFYETFHKNKLSSLSLCNIFNIEELLENMEYDEEL